MSIQWWEKTIHDLHWPSLTFLDLPWPSMTFHDLLWPSITFYHLLRPLRPSLIICLLSRPALIAGPLHSIPLQINSQSIPRLDPIDSKSCFWFKIHCTFSSNKPNKFLGVDVDRVNKYNTIMMTHQLIFLEVCCYCTVHISLQGLKENEPSYWNMMSSI